MAICCCKSKILINTIKQKYIRDSTSFRVQFGDSFTEFNKQNNNYVYKEGFILYLLLRDLSAHSKRTIYTVPTPSSSLMLTESSFYLACH